MNMLAERVNRERSLRTSGAGPKPSERLLQRIRAEFLEMPGLKLTLDQAQRVFGLDAGQARRLLWELREDGFLACDARGAYVRRGA